MYGYGGSWLSRFSERWSYASLAFSDEARGRGRAGGEASPPALPLTASWLLRSNQGRSTLGKVLEEMKISAAKKQVLQSITGAFPGNAVLHRWYKALGGLRSLWPPHRDAEPHSVFLSCTQGG